VKRGEKETGAQRVRMLVEAHHKGRQQGKAFGPRKLGVGHVGGRGLSAVQRGKKTKRKQKKKRGKTDEGRRADESLTTAHG